MKHLPSNKMILVVLFRNVQSIYFLGLYYLFKFSFLCLCAYVTLLIINPQLNYWVWILFEHRRDSFITHRAFCDALAEETARVNAASSMNSLANGTINYHLMGTPLGPSVAQHFSSIFKPISSSDETIDQTRQGLSLWMAPASQGHETIGNNLQEIHQVGSMHSGTAIFGDPLVSCSNPPPSDYHLNWVFGNKLSSNNAHEALASTSLPLTDVKEAATRQLVSVPSLYSSQQQTHQAASVNMSATALLQKAAQIGATSTDPSFLGSFGLKCSSNQVQDSNKFCGLYGSTAIANNLGTDVEKSGSDISTLSQLQMPPAKRRRLQSEDSAGGQTRDFLGVGMQAISCHPSSINGWIWSSYGN